MDNVDVIALTRKSVQSVFALISRQFILQIISLAAFIIISTHLTAGEIGIYTAVIAMQRIISFFTDFGLGAALVQKKEEVKDDDITTTFTIQVIITAIILLVVFLIKDILAGFFRLNTDATWLLLALVFTLFLSSFKIIPSVLLERKLNFQKLVIPQITESLIFNIILVVLILGDFGISSYTFAFLVSGIVGIPIYYLVHPWPVKLGITSTSLAHLKYGTQFQAKNILATVKDDFLTVILIRFLSFSEIGYIGFAQRWAFFAYRYIVDSVTKVTFSAYSRIQENTAHLGKAIEKSLFFTSLIMFPMMAGIIITNPYFIEFIPRWNNKWEPAIISLVFFSLNAAVSALSGILVNVMDATGRVKKTLQLMVLWTILIWILTPIFIYFYGYNGVSIASFLVTLTIFYTIHLVKEFVSFNFLKSIYKPLIATIYMSLFVYVFSLLFADSFMTLLFVILMGVAIYAFAIFLLARKELASDLKSFLKKT